MFDAWRMGVRALVVGAVAALATTGVASAQTINVGGSVNGQLTTSDTRGSGGQYQDVYTLRGRAGQTLQINLDGQGIDTLVRITGPGNFTAQDDDSGGNLNALLEVTLPANGEYRIYATTYAADITGAYTLRVSEAAPLRTSAIRVGQTIQGSLTNSDSRSGRGQYQDAYTFTGRAGQVLQINMNGEGIDSLVRINGPGGFTQQDDDSGGNRNAAMEVTLPTNGEYTIIATTFNADALGSYTLRLAEPAPLQASAIRVGQTVQGALASSDARTARGQYQDAYTFTGRAGQSLRITLEGDGLDTLVRVTGPNGFSEEDDDSGGRLNAMLDVTLPANGQYQVIATTYAANETGNYTLRIVENDPRRNAATAAATGAIRVGQTINGSLAAGDPTRSSGQFADAYTFEGQANQTVEIRLNATSYDPFLSISGPGNFQADNDDDTESSEPLRNSRLRVTLPQSGTYRIQATSYASGSTGDYRLSVAAASSAGATTTASQGTVLTLGQAASGRLQSGDGQLRSGEYADAYRFLGQAGQRVSIEMRSSNVDAYIILQPPTGAQRDNENDERGGTTNARLEITLEETGEYRLLATTSRPGEVGAYDIVVTDLGARRETSAAAPSAGATTLRPNQSVNGSLAGSDPTLDDGQHYDLYTFNGTSGQNVQIDLTSSQFDTFLVLITPSGELIEDDDGISGSTNSRIAGTLPESGSYTVVATSYSGGRTGNYALRFTVGGSSSTPVQPPAPSAQAGRVFLLSVGISDYGGQGDLPYTADDARNLYTALQQSGSLAQGSAVLTDGQATVANFRAAFQRIASQLGPNDLFFFFYSGHGGQEAARAGSSELDGREEYLVMRDGPITDDEMGRLFAGLRSRLSVIALDACFSGGFARDVITNPRIMGLFSSDEDLTSAVAGKFQAGGYLSHFLRTGFQGEADENRDGVITAGELHSYLWRRFAAEQNIGAQSMDGERSYQRLVVDRGGVKIDDVVLTLGR